MRAKVLITGGCTPRGISIAQALLKKEYDLTLFDSTPPPKNLKEKITFINGDITNKNTVLEALKNQQFVVHAVETTERQAKKKTLYLINVTGTENLLEASLYHNIERVIFLSTTAVYGIPRQLPQTEDSPLNPLDNYSTSKIIAEKLCRDFQEKGLSSTILRLQPVIGPENLGPFSIWFESIYNGHRVLLFDSGNNKFQLLSLLDLSEAVHKSLISETTNTIFNLGTNEYQSLKKDFQTVIRFDKAASKITGIPRKISVPTLKTLKFLHLSPFSSRYYELYSRSSYVTINKAEKKLGWSPKKSNKDLLLDSYVWYKKNRKKILEQREKAKKSEWDFKLLERLSYF